jgi:hypothetical protein
VANQSWVASRYDQRAKASSGLGRLKPDVLVVRHKQGSQPPELGKHARPSSKNRGCADAHDQPTDVRHVPPHHADREDEPLSKRKTLIQRTQGLVDWLRVECKVDRRANNGLFILKDPKQGPLGNSRGLSDLPTGDLPTMSQQQREGRGRDGGTSLVSRERRSPMADLGPVPRPLWLHPPRPAHER